MYQLTYSHDWYFKGRSAREAVKRIKKGKQKETEGWAGRRREKPELKSRGRGGEGRRAPRRGGQEQRAAPATVQDRGAHTGGSWGQRSSGQDPGTVRAPSGPGAQAMRPVLALKMTLVTGDVSRVKIMTLKIHSLDCWVKLPIKTNQEDDQSWLPASRG